MMRAVVGLTTAAAFLMATSAVAQQPAQPAAPQPAAKAAPDPNEIVCEKQEDTGSRISAHKVCMTRSQWAEQKRLNRKDLDKIQEQRGCNNGC